MKTALLYLCILGLTLCQLIGCSAPQQSLQAFESSTTRSGISRVKPNSLFWATSMTLPTGMDSKEYVAISKSLEQLPEVRERIPQIAFAASWQEAHQAATKAIEFLEGKPFAYFEQLMFAAGMLRNFLMYLEPSGEAIPAMRYYMDIVYRHNYVLEANLIAQMLPKMKGIWDKEKIKNMAEATLKARHAQFTLSRYLVERAQSKQEELIYVWTTSSPEATLSAEDQALARDSLRKRIPQIQAKAREHIDTKGEERRKAQEKWTQNPSLDPIAIVALLAESGE